MGSPPVKLGRENTEDIQASLSLHDGISPYFAQRRAPLIVVGPRVWNKHDVIFQAGSHPGPVVRPQGSHINQCRRILEDWIVQNPPVIDADIFLHHAHIQQSALDRGF